MFDKDNKFGFIINNNNESNNIKNTDLPYIKSETALLNITVDQLNKAWAECQASDDTSMYIEIPNFTIKDDTLFFIEINNKRYRLDSVYTEELTKQNKTRVIMEFFGINDTVNNIGGGDVQTFYDKTEEYNENVALMVLNRINDNKPPVFTGGIKLFEISINKFNTLLLGKDVDIYNSLSIRRDPNSKIGEYSTAMGCFTIASGNCSHAEGLNTTASGDYGSHAEGKYTTASADNSHAEGHKTKASGTSSHAEGWYTVASSYCSHAEGFNAISSGLYSHAEGNGTTASGENSHAEGKYTKASSINQHVQGKYNIEDTEGKYAHIVGNGSSDKKRANAHTLDWQGNAWYAGKLSQEGTPTEDKDLTTKKYVDDSRDYYFKTPTILYDDPNLPKGYVDITTLEKGTNYRVNSSIVSGFFKVSLKAPNDDGTWFTVDDGSNTIGWSSMLSTSICVQLKSDTFIAINMNCINNYCKYLSITKENGKWKLMQTQLTSISPDNTYEYDVTNDYNPAHKKYVDDKVSNLPQFSFNENGELVVKIGDTTKIFVPKE